MGRREERRGGEKEEGGGKGDDIAMCDGFISQHLLCLLFGPLLCIRKMKRLIWSFAEGKVKEARA